MKFYELLNQYEMMLNILNIHQQRDRKPVDWLLGAHWANSIWFRELKISCEDFPKMIPLTEEESNQYIDQDTNEKASFKLNYRDKIIPIWVDDAGQQFYAIYEETLFSSGSYCLCPEIVLSDQIDSIIDQEFID